jgi:hypothetical protein
LASRRFQAINLVNKPGTYVMIIKIFSPKNLAKQLFFFAQTTASFSKKIIITLVFEKNANCFRRKFAKIAENCDHNIDPFSGFWVCT